MVAGQALGPLCARRPPTERNALLGGSLTALVVSAVCVLPAAHWHTGHVGITLQTSIADTLGLVELDLALCVLSAGGADTGIFALVGETGLVVGAVGVDSALDCKKLQR